MHKQLRKKDIKELNQTLKEKFCLENYLDKRDNIQMIDNIIIKNNKKLFFYSGENDETLIPSLHLILENNFLKKVTVDMGAVRFVTSGADVMRPGITRFDSGIIKDELVAIVDEKHGKPLAIGRMLFSSEDAMAEKSGKIIKSLHYVGDEFW